MYKETTISNRIYTPISKKYVLINNVSKVDGKNHTRRRLQCFLLLECQFGLYSEACVIIRGTNRFFIGLDLL